MARLSDYHFGHIVVDGTVFAADLIVLPGRLVTEWWRRQGHVLSLEDLAEVIDELPERLIIGTGAYGMMRPEQELVSGLSVRGIHVEVMTTAQAVRRYGELDPELTAAALHLTC